MNTTVYAIHWLRFMAIILNSLHILVIPFNDRDHVYQQKQYPGYSVHSATCSLTAKLT